MAQLLIKSEIYQLSKDLVCDKKLEYGNFG